MTEIRISSNHRELHGAIFFRWYVVDNFLSYEYVMSSGSFIQLVANDFTCVCSQLKSLDFSRHR